MIEPTDIAAAVYQAWSRKTEPPGALGRLEALATRLAVIQRTTEPTVRPCRLLLFAADHGVAARGVSAFPQSVTGAMIANFLQGGAAVSVLARLHQIELTVTNLGLVTPPSAWPHPVDGVQFHDASLGPGTRDFTQEPAMTPMQCEASLEIGRQRVREAMKEGVRCLLLGEMGIGNTTAASACLAAVGAVDPTQAVGRGTGVPDEGLDRKQQMVNLALQRHEPYCRTSLDWLQHVGGFEITALTGAILEAREHQMPTIIDGFVVTAAAAMAHALDAGNLANCLFAHRSAEAPHRSVLSYLDARPIFDLEMRLGEGSAAALVLPILDSACHLLKEMATMDKLEGGRKS